MNSNGSQPVEFKAPGSQADRETIKSGRSATKPARGRPLTAPTLNSLSCRSPRTLSMGSPSCTLTGPPSAALTRPPPPPATGGAGAAPRTAVPSRGRRTSRRCGRRPSLIETLSNLKKQSKISYKNFQIKQLLQ